MSVIAFPIQFIPKEKYLDEEDPKDILPVGCEVWQCNCSSHLFFLTPDGAMCSNCGIITSDWCD